MKKLLLTLTVVCGLAYSGFAQTTTATTTSSPAKGGGKFSVGAEVGLPVGDISTGYDVVYGGSLKYELPTADRTYLTLSAGYNAFHLKSMFQGPDVSSTSGFVPLKAGIKYYTDGNLFIEGQAGIVFSTESGGGHAFAWSPGIGYCFDGGFEIGARYEGWTNGSTISQVGLRVAYRF